MINLPDYKVRAIHGESLDKNDLEIIDSNDIIIDKKLVELQIWDCNPKLITKNNIVDPVSLYASLKEEDDERIEHAIDEVLKGKKWYTD